MISLPPGCTINYEVNIIMTDLPKEFLAWWLEVGGVMQYNEWYDHRGRQQRIAVVRYGQGRPSHKLQNQQDEYMVRFRPEDAGVALMLLMKFTDLVKSHNMKEVEQYVY